MRRTHEHPRRTVIMGDPDKPGHDAEGLARDHVPTSIVSGVHLSRRRSVRDSGVSPS
jgi:hypothetical protein